MGLAERSGPWGIRWNPCRRSAVAEQPDATHRRISEAGDLVPSSQDPATRTVQNLCISESPVASAALPAPPPPTMGSSRRPPRPKQQPREPRNTFAVRSAGPVADAHRASTDGVLVQHVGQKHGGQTLLEGGVGLLRCLNRQPCVHCDTVRSQRCRRCNSCGFGTPLRELRGGDTFQDGRQRGHQDAAAIGMAACQYPPQKSRPVPNRRTTDDSPFPNCPIRDIVLTDRDKQLLPELRQASAMALPRCLVSRYATAWAESLQGTMSGHLSWALLCRFRCRLLLAEIPKGVDRNSELRQRLQQWE